MFDPFSHKKINYESGQIFPFMIAILCVLVVLIMITVNIGQVAIMKTDVSNAADAASLAGVSVLSNSLVGFGLKSDAMCGYGLAAIIVAFLLELLPFVGWVCVLATLIALSITQIMSYIELMGNGIMAWSNAKKTAIQYAFNNIGVDEPRLTYQQYLNKVYPPSGTCPSVANCDCYQEYVTGDPVSSCGGNPSLVKEYSRTGFSRFMQDSDNGYWKWGEPQPGASAPGSLSSGYGWTQVLKPGGYETENSYDTPGGDYRTYDNFVEASVFGSSSYILYMYKFPLAWQLSIAAGLAAWCFVETFLQYSDLGLIGAIIGLILGIIVAIIVFFLVFAGLSFGISLNNNETPDRDESWGQTNNNPLVTTVARYKKSNPLGLWTFRYGPKDMPIQAQSYAIVDMIGENGNAELQKTIDPLLLHGIAEWVGDFFRWMGNGFSGPGPAASFKTDKHVFETRLINTPF